MIRTMEINEYKPLMKIEGNGSKCNYALINPKGEIVKGMSGGNCHGADIKYIENNNDTFLLFFTIHNNYYSKEDMERFCEFCNEAGFPNQWQGKQSIDFKMPSYYNLKGEYYQVKLPLKKYVSGVHIAAGVTAIRLASYDLDKSFKDIPFYALDIKNELGDKVDHLQALLIAHLNCVKSSQFGLEYCINHTLQVTKDKPITKQEMLERIKKSNTINDTFENYNKRLKLPLETLYNLLQNKQYKEIIQSYE